MSVFAIISVQSNPKIDAAIQNHFAEDSFKYSLNVWFVSSSGTSKEVAELLKITDKEQGPGSAVILSVSGYWGRASQDVWEWMRVKWEKGHE